jgi:hypothetical protein
VTSGHVAGCATAAIATHAMRAVFIWQIMATARRRRYQSFDDVTPPLPK